MTPALKPPLDPGERAIKWINKLTLVGDYLGQRMRLRPWQSDIIRRMFGTLKPDGSRQYKRIFIFLPRKQGKTQLIACVGLFMLLGDRRRGQEIGVGASDREQAGILFNMCVAMIEADPFLAGQVRIYFQKQRIVCRKSGNILKVLSGQGFRGHGGNYSTVIIDEVHAQRDRRLMDAMTGGGGTRKAPTTILISTAGEDAGGLCRAELTYAKGVLSGAIDNPRYLAILYAADPDDDWTDEATWRKAMPALGDFGELDHIRDEFQLAREMPSEEFKFRTYYLNQFVGADTKWLNSAAWEECGGPAVPWDALRGRPCYAGLDLSSTRDTTALVLLFPFEDDTYVVRCWFWMPRGYAEERQHKDGIRFLDWARLGYLTLTEGRAIDHDAIEDKILKVASEVKIRDLRIDRYNAWMIAGRLMARSLPVQFMGQNPAHMNAGVKFLEVLIAEGRLRHGDDPVLTWQAGNVCSKTDEYDNIAFSKQRSADKIDGPVCLAMAAAGALVVATEATAEMMTFKARR